MDRDVEATPTLHKNLKATQKWEQEKEDTEEEEEEEEEYGEEAWGQGRGWPVVLAGFVINMLSAVSINSFGILFSPRLLELGSSPMLVSGVANATLAAANLLCLPVAPILHRWGCRRFLLTVGLVYSAAFALAALAFSTAGPFAVAAITAGSCRQVMFVVVQVSVCRCFQRRRPLAMGVTMAGGSVSQIMVPPLVAFMQNHYNPRTALLMIGVIMLHICIAAALLPSDTKGSAPCRVDYLAVVRQRHVALLCLVVALGNATLAVFWATVPLVLLDTGHSSREVALYVSVAGMATLATRVTIGLLLCYFSQPTTVVRLASAVAAATIPVWYWSERLIWRAAWLSVCGASSGVVLGLSGLVVLEVVGLRWQAEMLSLVYLSTGVVTLLFGELTDLVQEVTGSYVSKLHAMSGLLVLSQVLWESLDAQAYRASFSTAPSNPIAKETEDTDGVQMQFTPCEQRELFLKHKNTEKHEI